MFDKIQIGKLFQDLLDKGHEIKSVNGYELIDCSFLGLQTKSLNGWVPIRFLSRHKTPKHLVEITVAHTSGKKQIIVTTDHVCMVFSKEWILEEKSAKDLAIGDYVNLCDDEKDDLLGTICSIKDIGTTDKYVYDMELDDENKHWFFANDILVHNSQFLNIEYITDYFKEHYSLPDKLMDWPDEYKLKLWRFMEKFVDEKVNPFVHKLIKDKCYSDHGDVLNYSLEYIADAGIYEQKKRYCVHRMVEEGPILVDKLVYKGIELKRSNIPQQSKVFLKEIYENTLLKNWNSDDYRKYIDDAYERFKSMPIEDISLWMGWNSDEIEDSGFLKFGKGTTYISKACKTHNQLLSKLHIGKKYESIKLGDTVRICYVNPSNLYRVEAIAFLDGLWPTEFNKYFTVDYPTMFDKTILSRLKSFRGATKFADYSPLAKTCEDVFAL